jgi:PII-like signaling protein
MVFAAYNKEAGGDMLNAGPAKKVTVYVGQDQQYHGDSTYAAILQFLFYRKVSGATVTRGIAGFGANHRMQTDRILALTENLPMKVEFIETAEKVEDLLPKLHEMVGTGLIEIQDTTIVKAAESSEQAARQVSPSSLKQAGTAKLMRIFVGENDKWNGKPLHKALMESMRANDIAGVTVYQGILGYGANRRIHKDSALHLSHDRPMMLSVVDTEERLRAFLPVLDDMVQQGLVVFSDVDVIKYTHNYQDGERRKAVRP